MPLIILVLISQCFLESMLLACHSYLTKLLRFKQKETYLCLDTVTTAKSSSSPILEMRSTSNSGSITSLTATATKFINKEQRHSDH